MFTQQFVAIAAENDSAFNRVLEFTHIAGPWMGHECCQTICRDGADVNAMFAGEALQKLLGEEWNVVATFTQWRNEDGDDVEPEEQVLAKFLFLDALFQVAVCGGNDANIDFDCSVATDSFQFPFLQYSEKFCLDLG